MTEIVIYVHPAMIVFISVVIVFIGVKSLIEIIL